MRKIRRPFANDGNIVLDTLVVDVCALFEERDGDLCIADAGGDSGHTSGKTAHQAQKMKCWGDCEHRRDKNRRWKELKRMFQRVLIGSPQILPDRATNFPTKCVLLHHWLLDLAS